PPLALPAAPARTCDAGGCSGPGPWELQIIGTPREGQLAERDPTWRCDRHRDELQARWPGGWHVNGERPAWQVQREAEEAAVRARETSAGPPNVVQSASRLPWDAPGGGVLAWRSQEPR
ncbi:MAG: hypothetical protein ACRDOK_22700, partial [Streptosporangiaceae bacterium]